MTFENFRKPLYYFLLLTSMIILDLSCNYFTEPEPILNKNALPPKIHYGTANFKDYSQNQLVTGTISMVFTPDWNPSSTDSVLVYVDSTLIRRLYWDYATYMPFYFEINTRRWPNGKHNIFIYAYRNPILDDSLGTMSLLTNTLFVLKNRSDL